MNTILATPALSKLIKLYLDESKIRNLSPDTISSRRTVLEDLVDHSGDELSTDRDMAVGFLARYYDRGLKPSSIACYHTNCRLFYRWLVDTGRADANPFAQVPKAKSPHRYPRIVSRDDLGKLWRATYRMTGYGGQRTRCLMMLMLTTGVRRKEAASLDLYDIDRLRGVVTVRHGKGGKERHVPVPLEIFGEWLKIRDSVMCDTEAVFITRNHTRVGVKSLNRDFHQLKLWAGAAGRCSPHDFRHLFASGCVDEGVHLEALRQMLGHESLGTTGRYLQMAIKPLAAEMARVRPLELVKAQIGGRVESIDSRRNCFDGLPDTRKTAGVRVSGL